MGAGLVRVVRGAAGESGLAGLVGVERDDVGLGRRLGGGLGEGDGDGVAGLGDGAGLEFAGGFEALDGFEADEVVDGEGVFFLLLGGEGLVHAEEVVEGAGFALSAGAALAAGARGVARVAVGGGIEGRETFGVGGWGALVFPALDEFRGGSGVEGVVGAGVDFALGLVDDVDDAVEVAKLLVGERGMLWFGSRHGVGLAAEAAGVGPGLFGVGAFDHDCAVGGGSAGPDACGVVAELAVERVGEGLGVLAEVPALALEGAVLSGFAPGLVGEVLAEFCGAVVVLGDEFEAVLGEALVVVVD